MTQITQDEVIAALKHVIHPALKKSIVELGMIEELSIENLNVALRLKFQKANDPMRGAIMKACQKALVSYVHPEAQVLIAISTPENNSQQNQKPANTLPPKKSLPARNVIAVASGKGGVGKSTVSVNLAVALASLGFKVGLLDADIYGPSIPKMLGTEGIVPEITGDEGQERFLPIKKFNIELNSIGYFVRPEDALIWRGPRATSALRQLLFQTQWSDLDYLLIDLPPGTGDVHLTLLQELEITAAIIVTTPQQVALADVIKGINLFKADSFQIPILGIVENMAWFTPKELPDNKYFIFGKGKVEQFAKEENLEILGQIPLIQSIAENSDEGTPIASNSKSPEAAPYIEIAKKIHLTYP